ncbi:YbaK/EbsC family protein [Raineyella fluvialis]|uniref:Rieske 2Fe-2S domain-containing protein n=1 Tax=Raineyella fluvialis TaxID=2662261 RepID=A0A5Q2FA41_9ACTN|nr:YbaK/EbsC family protein [Raineyella fluvialis]QGF23548.1 Rieske 2Fe-2S domain-containing protein [Raineyella fluvialis]
MTRGARRGSSLRRWLRRASSRPDNGPPPAVPLPPLRVGTVGDLADGAAIVVPGGVNGTGADIAVFRSAGRLYALDDACTHRYASLADGWIEDGWVECPVHEARFSLVTGEALSLPATVSARTHRVELRGDEVWLHPGTPAGHAGTVTEPPLPGADRALAALERTGASHRVRTHLPSTSLEEHAAAIGVPPSDLTKTLVVRRAAEDYFFLLVPGGRKVSWKKVRAALGVNRLTMPGAEEAREVTGYERGTITPFGATHAWPVYADRTLVDPPGREVSIGGGDHGTAFVLAAEDLVAVLGATVIDVTDPE